MRNNMALGWFYSPSQILHYFPSRVTSLKPPRAQLKNPYAILRQLDAHQWNMFFVGFAAWAWDGKGRLSLLESLPPSSPVISLASSTESPSTSSPANSLATLPIRQLCLQSRPFVICVFFR